MQQQQRKREREDRALEKKLQERMKRTQHHTKRAKVSHNKENLHPPSHDFDIDPYAPVAAVAEIKVTPKMPAQQTTHAAMRLMR